VKSNLDNKKLYLVPNARVFRRPAFVVYPEDSSSETISLALGELRQIAVEI